MLLMKGSWSDASEKLPELSQAENEYAVKLERERTLRHTLQALQENKVAEAKTVAAKLQKKVCRGGVGGCSTHLRLCLSIWERGGVTHWQAIFERVEEMREQHKLERGECVLMPYFTTDIAY
jgi:hypothetical protein